MNFEEETQFKMTTKNLKVGDIHTYTIVEKTEDAIKITFNIKPEVYVDEIIVHPVLSED